MTVTINDLELIQDKIIQIRQAFTDQNINKHEKHCRDLEEIIAVIEKDEREARYQNVK